MKNMENFVSKYTDINELGVMRNGYDLLLWLGDDKDRNLKKNCHAEIKRINDLIERRRILNFTPGVKGSLILFTLLAVATFILLPPIGLIPLVLVCFMVLAYIKEKISFRFLEKDLNLTTKPELLLELGKYYNKHIFISPPRGERLSRVYKEVGEIIKQHTKSPLANLFKNDSLDSPEEENNEQAHELFNPMPMGKVNQCTVSTQCNLFGDRDEIKDEIPAPTYSAVFTRHI